MIRLPLADVQLSVRAQVQPAVPAELEHDELRHQSAEVAARGFLLHRSLRIPGIVSVTRGGLPGRPTDRDRSVGRGRRGREQRELVMNYDRYIGSRRQLAKSLSWRHAIYNFDLWQKGEIES